MTKKGTLKQTKTANAFQDRKALRLASSCCICRQKGKIKKKFSTPNLAFHSEVHKWFVQLCLLALFGLLQLLLHTPVNCIQVDCYPINVLLPMFTLTFVLRRWSARGRPMLPTCRSGQMAKLGKPQKWLWKWPYNMISESGTIAKEKAAGHVKMARNLIQVVFIWSNLMDLVFR